MVSEACIKLGNRIATGLNSAASINPVNLVATALLTTPRQSMTDERLQRMIDDLLSIAKGMNTAGEYSIVDLDASSIIEQAESIADITRTTQNFGDILSASASAAVLLTYYRNNTIHVYALPSMIARWIKQSGSVSADDLLEACFRLYPFLESEFFLPFQQTELRTTIEQILEIFGTIGVIEFDHVDGGSRLVSAPAPTSDGYASLMSLSEIIEPTLERYYILVSLLEQHSEQKVMDLEMRASKIGHQLSAFYGINSPEFFDKSLFATFIKSLDKEDIIKVTDGWVTASERLAEIKVLTGITLDSDLRYDVIQLATKSVPETRQLV
jgi:glycerol-3-phosphate O-acyltransferase